MQNNNNIKLLEKKFSEDLDNLLIQNGILKERGNIFPISNNIPGYQNSISFLILKKEEPRINFRIEIYPQEVEEPHFLIRYQNETCRFKIIDGSPYLGKNQEIPVKIKKILKEIKQIYSKHKTEIEKAWNTSRNSQTPPQSILSNYQKTK